MENIFETEVFDLVSVMKNPGKGEDHEQDVEKIDEEKVKENNTGHKVENHCEHFRHFASSV